MKALLKNPLSLWLVRRMKASLLEYTHRGMHLKIGYMSELRDCQFGEYSTIYDNVFAFNCTIGNFTYISSGTQIANTKIGKFCSIGPDCKIGLGKHPTSGFISTHPIFYSTKKQAQITFADRDYFEETDEIRIGNDVWLGARVIIVDGVSIGDGAMVAAASAVTKDVPPYAIVGGVPARIIRKRFEEDDVRNLMERKWWDQDVEFLKAHFKTFHDIREYLDQ